MRNALIVVLCTMAVALSACAGTQQGTETDNTDIGTPETVQKIVDEAHSLEFLYDADWNASGALDDGSLAFTCGASSVRAAVEEGVTGSLAAVAGNGATACVANEDFECLRVVRLTMGSHIEERYLLRRETGTLVRLTAAFVDARVEFPVEVRTLPIEAKIVQPKVDAFKGSYSAVPSSIVAEEGDPDGDGEGHDLHGSSPHQIAPAQPQQLEFLP